MKKNILPINYFSKSIIKLSGEKAISNGNRL